MSGIKLILALETSCDETAAAVLEVPETVRSSEVSTQVALHRPFGGVVPEVASRNHMVMVRPVVEAALERAGVALADIGAFAATAGPGLASSLLVGNTVAKAFAAAADKLFLAINHLEGHLLSPYLGTGGGVRPAVALVVSGGHTLLVRVGATPGGYRLLGKTRDDAAGEAFDKVGKMLGFPYPGGPEVEKHARGGDPAAFAFPRSMLGRAGGEFSFSGLKTAMRYTLEKLPDRAARLADLCASFQEAVVEVLVEKAVAAAKRERLPLLTLSGGVSCNRRLREAMAARCRAEGIELLVAEPALTTDNAAMIAYVAAQRLAAWGPGAATPLESDIDPNLALV